MRLIRLKMVVLPAPFGPMMEKTSPSSTSKLTASTARMPPKRMAMSSARNRLIGGHSLSRCHAGCAMTMGMAGSSPAMTIVGTATSSQPLRAGVGFLSPEARAALQRIGLEPVLDLDPASIDAAGLEQDHDDQ